jgi:acyl transferase domain-containing protein
MTFPGLQGQVDVISSAYKLSGLDRRLTSYVECHGTGTPTGTCLLESYYLKSEP